ncbi:MULTISPECIES: YggT family protein [unclassified Curtobacterium]|uniref:YggT family protein n=1 Tax=unclassified Curtobacterium TaxID=257496 RepID=UPI000A62FB5E|nr:MULTISPECIES: YggT family protein [unclassified Curtobacterium]WIA98119.1 YggT family protein [Curtobacterium sp. MCBA15_004]WIB01372.1 YggT family protein [Curtobacterium sp. MCBA15_012]
MSLVFGILSFALLLYFFVMWGRFALDIVQAYNRSWRPRGGVLVLSEFVYTVTDPPIRAVRKLLPPLRMGPVALDFGWTIVMLVVIILRVIVGTLARSF